MPTLEDVMPMEEGPSGAGAGDQDGFHSSKSESQDYRDAEKICNTYSGEVILMAAMRFLRLNGRTA